MKNFQAFEQFLNESTTLDPRVKKEAISRLSQFFKVSPSKLSKFNFDGTDNIKELTNALDSTNDEGTKIYYNTAIRLAKEEFGINEKSQDFFNSLEEKTKGIGEGIGFNTEAIASELVRDIKEMSRKTNLMTAKRIVGKPDEIVITRDFDEITLKITGVRTW
jgi:hypothetical protein